MKKTTQELVIYLKIDIVIGTKKKNLKRIFVKNLPNAFCSYTLKMNKK